MNFFYYNNMGDNGYFEEDNLIRAIYSCWNIEESLYLLNGSLKFIDDNKLLTEQAKLIFAPFADNEFNSDLLLDFGYKMIDVI